MTNNQIFHRQFIASPLWQEIRRKALQYHGSQCNSCECVSDSLDVHHKIYERFGGGELMTDLEILCRSCHDARHAVEKSQGIRASKRKRPWVHAAVAYRYLTQAQKNLLIQKFQLENETKLILKFKSHRGAMFAVRKMLSVNIIELNRRVYNKLVS